GRGGDGPGDGRAVLPARWDGPGDVARRTARASARSLARAGAGEPALRGEHGGDVRAGHAGDVHGRPPREDARRRARRTKPGPRGREPLQWAAGGGGGRVPADRSDAGGAARSEEHTSELQSLAYLVCRLLLDKKNERHAMYTGRAVT